MTDRSIVLDLDQLNNPRGLDTDHFFYRQELVQFFKLITRFAEIAKGYRESGHGTELPREVFYNAVSLIGSRGAGKTTFLKTIEALEPSVIEAECGHSIAVLDVLDPSLIEDSEIFLAVVTTAISKHVDDVMDAQRRSDARYSLEGEEAYRKAKQELAVKFRALASGSVVKLWADYDEELLAHEMTRFARGGLTVSEAFHIYLFHVCRVLGVDLLVLPIDDVDTQFDNGFKVLESVRRYFTSPYLVPVISGRLELFQLVLANHFFAEVRDIPRDDKEKRDQVVKEVGRLTNQYVLKIMRPNYRIELAPIVDRWNGILPFQDAMVSKGDDARAISQLLVDFLKAALRMRIPYISSKHVLNPRTNPYANLLPRNNRLLVALLSEIIEVVHGFDNVEHGANFSETFGGLLQVLWHQFHHLDVTLEDLIYLQSVGGEASLAAKMMRSLGLDLFEIREAVSPSSEFYLGFALTIVLVHGYREKPYRLLDCVLMCMLCYACKEKPGETLSSLEPLGTKRGEFRGVMGPFGLEAFRKKMVSGKWCRPLEPAESIHDLRDAAFWLGVQDADSAGFFNFFLYLERCTELISLIHLVLSNLNIKEFSLGDQMVRRDWFGPEGAETLLTRASIIEYLTSHIYSSDFAQKNCKIEKRDIASLERDLFVWYDKVRDYTFGRHQLPIVEIIIHAVARFHQFNVPRDTSPAVFFAWFKQAFVYALLVEENRNLGKILAPRFDRAFEKDEWEPLIPDERGQTVRDDVKIRREETLSLYLASFPLFLGIDIVPTRAFDLSELDAERERAGPTDESPSGDR